MKPTGKTASPTKVYLVNKLLFSINLLCAKAGIEPARQGYESLNPVFFQDSKAGKKVMTVGVWKRSVLVFAMSLGLAVSAQAAHLTSDYRSAQPQAALRDGDFDGDGRVEALRLVNDAGTGRISVQVTLAGEEVRITSFDSASAPSIRVAPAGVYAVDCGSFSTDCATRTLEIATDGVIVAMDGGVSVLLHWRGGAFEPEFVKSEDDGMARVASLLYALNR